MLAARAWALRREDAIEVLAVLYVALQQLEEIQSKRRHPSRGGKAADLYLAGLSLRDTASDP